MDYLIEIGATDAKYEHSRYVKFHATWFCAGYGDPNELKKILEHSREGLDNFYGEIDTSALAQAFMHEEPKYRVTNVKLLLEYGADPNARLRPCKDLAPLHMVISNFLEGE